MNLRGGRLQGAKYGQLSPLDYTGLKGWYRFTDGLTMVRGNIIKGIKDLSGFGADLLGSGPSNAGSTLVNSPFGVGIGPYSVNGVRQAMSTNNGDTSFMVNGSPHTFIYVWYCGDTLATTSDLIATNSGANTTNTTNWTIVRGQTGAGYNRAYSGNRELYTFNFTNGIYPNVARRLSVETNYGSINGNNPLLKHQINEVTTPSTNAYYITKTAYVNAPTGSEVASGYLLQLGLAGVFLEMLWYDHTGKSRAQIDTEMNNLVQNYFKVRYPNFY